jgi:hypothetical protein
MSEALQIKTVDTGKDFETRVNLDPKSLKLRNDRDRDQYAKAIADQLTNMMKIEKERVLLNPPQKGKLEKAQEWAKNLFSDKKVDEAMGNIDRPEVVRILNDIGARYERLFMEHQEDVRFYLENLRDPNGAALAFVMALRDDPNPGPVEIANAANEAVGGVLKEAAKNNGDWTLGNPVMPAKEKKALAELEKEAGR